MVDKNYTRLMTQNASGKITEATVERVNEIIKKFRFIFYEKIIKYIVLIKKLTKMKKTIFIPILMLLFLAGCNKSQTNSAVNKSADKSENPATLVAKRYFSGFDDAHDTYNAISKASDGKIYYVLSSTRHDVGGQFYSYDPLTDKTEFVADLSEALGEKRTKIYCTG